MHVIHGAGAQPERAMRDIFTGEVHSHSFVDDRIGEHCRAVLPGQSVIHGRDLVGLRLDEHGHEHDDRIDRRIDDGIHGRHDRQPDEHDGTGH